MCGTGLTLRRRQRLESPSFSGTPSTIERTGHGTDLVGRRVAGRRGQRGRARRPPDRLQERAGRRSVRERPSSTRRRATRTCSRWWRRTSPPSPTRSCPTRSRSKGATQAVQMFGPAQAAVARAVVDSVREGVIAEGDVDDLCIIVGVFIHWEATDDKKIFDYNYQATKESIARALGNEPSLSDDPRLLGGGAAPVRGGRRGLADDPAGRPAGRRDRREQRHRTRHRRGLRRRGSRGPAHAPCVARARACGRRGDRGARRARARLPGRPRDARGLRAPGRRGARAARRARRLGQQRRRGRAHRRGGGVGVGAQARRAAGRRPQGDDRVLVRGRGGHAQSAAGRSST